MFCWCLQSAHAVFFHLIFLLSFFLLCSMLISLWVSCLVVLWIFLKCFISDYFFLQLLLKIQAGLFEVLRPKHHRSHLELNMLHYHRKVGEGELQAKVKPCHPKTLLLRRNHVLIRITSSLSQKIHKQFLPVWKNSKHQRARKLWLEQQQKQFQAVHQVWNVMPLAVKGLGKDWMQEVKQRILPLKKSCRDLEEGARRQDNMLTMSFRTAPTHWKAAASKSSLLRVNSSPGHLLSCLVWSLQITGMEVVEQGTLQTTLKMKMQQSAELKWSQSPLHNHHHLDISPKNLHWKNHSLTRQEAPAIIAKQENQEKMEHLNARQQVTVEWALTTILK